MFIYVYRVAITFAAAFYTLLLLQILYRNLLIY